MEKKRWKHKIEPSQTSSLLTVNRTELCIDGIACGLEVFIKENVPVPIPADEELCVLQVLDTVHVPSRREQEVPIDQAIALLLGQVPHLLLALDHHQVVAEGDTKLGECTGICIETSCPDATSFLTSRLLIPLTWPTRKITENLTIEVHLPNGRTVTGWIEHPGRYVDFFIVNVKDLSVFDAAPVSLDCDMQFEPYRKVAAVWRNFSSGVLRARSGVDLASLSALTCETMLSTCQINKAGIGGPLVDFDGNFVGMNCSRTRMKKTPYV
ncbi:hypothetical protein TRIUR3_02853 [Triticum urartu]|uniref:Uncharacterized protein n=1 Tax=Triticum urartu TaxID=4572 RepID=M8AB01_TRIUA|nr:hypothetical protein TRIUR3_02853 [Triticum urartu]